MDVQIHLTNRVKWRIKSTCEYILPARTTPLTAGSDRMSGVQRRAHVEESLCRLAWIVPGCVGIAPASKITCTV